MPLASPELDDRRFEDLVREALTLIPRYAPEWTQLNDGDPGVTFLQIQAWLTETLLYRFNQVPERHYVKFLELLGIQRRPAQPARADLTFKPSELNFSETAVPRYTQVAASGAPGGEPLLFEVDRSIFVLGAELDRIATWDGARHALRNDFPLLPFGTHPAPGHALVLGLKSEALQFTSQVFEIAFYVTEPPRAAFTSSDARRYPVPARLIWEYWDGPRARYRELELLEDETRAFTLSGRVRLRGPGAAFAKAQLRDLPEERHWLRVRLVQSDYDRPPRFDGVQINTARATQAVSVFDEVLGRSDGSPEQSFRTQFAPIVIAEEPDVVRGAAGEVTVPSLQLDVIETGGSTPVVTTWQEVRDFDGSGPDSRHFVVDHATGRVSFGDGVHGAVPRLTTQIVARRYRYGGGRQGRVGAGQLRELMGSITGINGVTNHRPSFGGADEEPLEQTKRRAPRLLSSRDRAVTSEDTEHLALQTPFVSVARAKALPLVHPDFPNTEVPGVVTVVVVPDADGDAPVPGETTLRSVCLHLDSKRLLTTELHVVGPTYRRLAVEVDLIVDTRADLARVQRQAEGRLREFLHPLRGGLDGTGWPFGGTLFFSEIYRQLLSLDDVLRVEQQGLRLILEGVAADDCRDVPIGPAELFAVDEILVRPRYDEVRR